MENSDRITVVNSDTIINLDGLTVDMRYPILYAVKMFSDGGSLFVLILRQNAENITQVLLILRQDAENITHVFIPDNYSDALSLTDFGRINSGTILFDLDAKRAMPAL